MKKLALTLALLLSPIAAFADESPAAGGAIPACNAKNVGIVQCMEQKMCECKYYHASAMKGTPERFGWDCGINRPTCLDYKTIETTKPYDGPQSVGIENNEKGN